MNSHKYNGGKSKEQPPEKLKKVKEKQKTETPETLTGQKTDGRTDRHVDI